MGLSHIVLPISHIHPTKGCSVVLPKPQMVGFSHQAMNIFCTRKNPSQLVATKYIDTKYTDTKYTETNKDTNTDAKKIEKNPNGWDSPKQLTFSTRERNLAGRFDQPSESEKSPVCLIIIIN